VAQGAARFRSSLVEECFFARRCVVWLPVTRRSRTNFETRLTDGLLIFAAFFGLTACTHPPAGGSAPAASAQNEPFTAPRRDLSQDEAAGGHTLRKHVGRTDAELRERLERERDISAASTWNDRASAEAAVGAAIAEQDTKISHWLERDRHPNLVLDYSGDPGHPFGRTLRRGEDQVQPCAQALIVLKWDPPSNYHVLTAYPECRQ
jgi:CDI toxin RNase A-like protein